MTRVKIHDQPVLHRSTAQLCIHCLNLSAIFKQGCASRFWNNLTSWKAGLMETNQIRVDHIDVIGILVNSSTFKSNGRTLSSRV